MRVGAVRVELHVSAAQSLKDKRRVIRSLKDRLFSRFNVSVAEVEDQDLWQKAVLGLAFIAMEAKSADGMVQNIEGFIRSHPGCSLLRFEPRTIDFDEFDERGPDMGEIWEKY